MDTIHHLLRINVEIEGALRVLATGDNEIALKILNEKTNELSEFVHHLIHPEEKIQIVQVEKEISNDGKSDFSKKYVEGQGIEKDSLCSIESSFISEVAPIPALQLTNEERFANDADSFDDPLTELDAADKVLVMEQHEKCRTETATNSNEHISELTLENKDENESRSQVDNNITDSTNSTLYRQQIIQDDTTFHEAVIPDLQKEKLRIDEMLSRREARNLSKAFTINDRFRFQSRIFGGNKDAFNTSIEAISSLKDYDSAIAYLSGITEIDTEDNDIADFLAIIQNHFEA